MHTGRSDPSVKRVTEADKVHFAREQRREPTKAEGLLWNCLRGSKLGVRFRRQHPFADFVLDFCTAQQRLAVEVDGPAHERQRNYDEWRDSQLSRHGIRVLRVPEAMIATHIEDVLEMIRGELRL